MKKTLFLVIFIFFALALTAQVKESKKIYKLQKAYIYLDEELLISESDLNCSYFIRDGMPQEIKVIASSQPDELRGDFADNDKLFIDQGSQDGLKEGDVLQLMGQGRHIRGFGRYFLKKSLAEITCIYEDRSVIQLKSGCHPVNVGDFAVIYKPEKTVFAKKINYLLCRIPANPVNGTIVYTDLWSGLQASISGSSQYVTVDLGQGVVAKGSFLLITRTLKRDLPPLIIGIGIVIQAENTNSTVKILDASSDIRVNDRVILLPVPKAGTPGADRDENIPIVDTLEAESQAEAQAGEITAADDSLNIDVFFDFFKPCPLQRFLAGIGQSDVPIDFILLVVDSQGVLLPERNLKIIGHGFVVVEIFFDLFAFIAKAQDRTLIPVMCIAPKDVPKDRAITNQHHWFWFELGFFL